MALRRRGTPWPGQRPALHGAVNRQGGTSAGPRLAASHRAHSLVLGLLLLLTAAPAWAQSDDEVFGDDKEPAIDESKLDAANDKLQIGGMLYMRFNALLTDSDSVKDHRLSMPNLVDLYLDGRPSDRLRGFVRGRLSFNPSVDESDALSKLYGGKQTDVILDQFWLKFDIARAAWFTIGKQHVRWGATRIWNPVDVVNLTQRVPLALFDERVGRPALKVHIPVESLGWNFYLLGMLDGVDTFDKAGVAGRAEFVFGSVEMGLTGAWRDNIDPKAGLDISAGVWDLDVTAEVGVTFPDEGDPSIQASGGLEYGIKYSDEDTLYLGGEYFFNQGGSSTTNARALLTGQTQFFYTGKHYAALFMSLPNPGLWNDTSFLVSAISNLSDKSVITRVDMSQRVLTFMTVQFFAAVHYGKAGELNFGGDLFSDEGKDQLAESLGIESDRLDRNPVVDLGVWLKIDL